VATTVRHQRLRSSLLSPPVAGEGLSQLGRPVLKPSIGHHPFGSCSPPAPGTVDADVKVCAEAGAVRAFSLLFLRPSAQFSPCGGPAPSLKAHLPGFEVVCVPMALFQAIVDTVTPGMLNHKTSPMKYAK